MICPEFAWLKNSPVRFFVCQVFIYQLPNLTFCNWTYVLHLYEIQSVLKMKALFPKNIYYKLHPYWHSFSAPAATDSQFSDCYNLNHLTHNYDQTKRSIKLGHVTITSKYSHVFFSLNACSFPRLETWNYLKTLIYSTINSVSEFPKQAHYIAPIFTITSSETKHLFLTIKWGLLQTITFPTTSGNRRDVHRPNFGQRDRIETRMLLIPK